VSEDQELTWGKVSNRAALELSNFTCNFVDVTFNRWMECEDLYHKVSVSLVSIDACNSSHLLKEILPLKFIVTIPVRNADEIGFLNQA